MPTLVPRLKSYRLYPGLVVVTLLVGLCARADEAERRPNIIYVLADDLGYGDLGCYGQQVIRTPRLDRLAAGGMRFTDHYAGSTVCAPSRCVLLTGLHTGHCLVRANGRRSPLRPQDATIGKLLTTAGYATGGVGKWSLGGVDTSGHPNQQGFGYWFGYLDQGRAHNYYPEYLWRNTEQVALPGNRLGPQRNVSVERVTYSHDLMVDEALSFIRRHRSVPFFLSVHLTIPHANNEGGRATGDGMEVPDYGPYADEDWPRYEKGQAAMITRMDADVGRMIDLLRDLDIDKETLVLFSSDNGPHQEGGHQAEFFDANGPLRGIKRDLYEGGIRVPMIAWWPGRIRPGTVSDHPSGFWDVMPTLCEVASVDGPPHIDGLSFLPELLEKPQPKHAYLYWEFGEKVAVRIGNFKGVRLRPDAAVELYDLSVDIGEQRNIAVQRPKTVGKVVEVMRTAHTAPAD